MDTKFERYTFGKRLKSMLKVDFRRMFGTKLFYIMLGIAVAVPVLILVMTTMMDGSVSVNPQTGEKQLLKPLTAHGRLSEPSAKKALPKVRKVLPPQ